MPSMAVKTASGLTRVADIAHEVVMTTSGYAQPATVSIGGQRIKGYVWTALAYQDKDGRMPFYTAQDPNPDLWYPFPAGDLAAKARVRKGYEEDVQHPGKFEGSPAWVPYFWDMVMDGNGESHYEASDDEDMDSRLIGDSFEPDADDQAMFPELADFAVVLISEDSQGFVSGRGFTNRDSLQAYLEAQGA